MHICKRCAANWFSHSRTPWTYSQEYVHHSDGNYFRLAPKQRLTSLLEESADQLWLLSVALEHQGCQHYQIQGNSTLAALVIDYRPMISFDLNISGTVSATYGTLIVLAISFGVAAIGISFKEWIVKCLETSIVVWRSFALLRPALDEGEKNQLLPALLQVQSHNFPIREEGIKNIT